MQALIFSKHKRYPSSWRWAIAVGGLAVIASGLVAGIQLARTAVPVQMDLGQWSRFPGAAVEGRQVHIHSLDRRIVNQDGSGGQPNPPVNVVGSHLAVSGDFQVTVTMVDAASGGAVFRLYGDVPGIYDEWRHDGKSVEAVTSQQGLHISVWDGKSATPVSAQFDTPIPNPATLQIAKRGSQLHFSINGRDVGAVHDPGISSSHNLWLGADAAPSGGGWTITSLTAAGLGWGSVQIVPAPTMAAAHADAHALRNAAAGRSFTIGTAVSLYSLMSDPKYRAIAIGQFNSWTPENEMKAQFIHPGTHVYSFSDADALVDTALANGITVHGHALVFAEANPKWMQDAPAASKPAIMRQHVGDVVAHFRGKVAEWDVVNEPLSDDDQDYLSGGLGLRHNIWYQAMGESYIDQAFRTARAADPAAKLYVNEYGLEQDGQRWDAMLALVKRLKSRGVPIDGIGFQAHIHEEGDEVDPDVLRRHFQQLNDLGLKVRISEIDVYGDDATVQADQYAGVLSACQSQANCTSWSTWGFTDLHGSTSTYTYPVQYGDDLIWDSNYHPKQSYDALLKTLMLTR